MMPLAFDNFFAVNFFWIYHENVSIDGINLKFWEIKIKEFWTIKCEPIKENNTLIPENVSGCE